MPRVSHPDVVSKILRSNTGPYLGIDQLDSIVFGRIVTGSDHDSNDLPILHLRPQCSDQSDTKDHRVQQFPRNSVNMIVTRSQPQASDYRLTPSSETEEWTVSLATRDHEGQLTPAVPY